ncbi:MAG: SusC/RagA family TonB-linked outer membrane protein, partial [Pedobacter sp.]
SPTIRIRGIGSVNANASPLIVVDGAPYGGNINSINPNDIESITVLKDASSTALYGSRAANGVLQIITKTGKGTPKVNVSVISGFSERAVNDYKYVSSQQQYELTWEALRNEALLNPALVSNSGSASAADYASKTVVGTLVYNPFGIAEPIGADGKLKSNAQLLWNEDWADALLQTGVRNDYNVSISGGNDRTRYYVSGGYLKDQGIAIESKFQRYSGRLKVDTKVNDWLNAGVNANVAYSTQNYPAQGGSAYSNVIGWIRNVSSLYPRYVLNPTTGQPILDANGQKQFDFGDNGPLTRPIFKPGNPLGTTVLNPTTYDRYITSVNAFAEAQIIRGLKFRTQYAIDLYQLNTDQYYNPFVGDGSAYGGRSYKGRENVITQTFTNTLTYDQKFGVHHINVLGGMEAYRYHDGSVAAESRGFTFPGVTELDYGSTPFTASSNSLDNRMVSYFSRLNYDFEDKYHLSASLRTDGSSRFADSVRWGTFYSVGAAWNLTAEQFLRGVTAVSSLKLRASYGTTGNQGLPGFFPYLGTYASGYNIGDYSGSVIASLSNGALKWEKQKTLDLGIDFGFLKERIFGSFTYFIRGSDDLLFNKPLFPSGAPVDGINGNLGKVENKGIEIDLTTVNVKTASLEWRTSFNLTKVKNKIKALPQESIAGPGLSNLKVGESLYNVYTREYAGVDAADGRPLWYMDEADGSGKVTKTITKTYSLATRYYLGSTLPDWSGGVTSFLSFKGFDLTILAAFNIGGKIYDGDYGGLMHGSTGVSPGYNWT